MLTNELNVGGIETNLVRLVDEFCSRGHEVVVATRGGTLAADVVAAGATHVTLRMAPGSLSALVADARALRRLIGDRRPDLIHVFSGTAAVVTWVALRYLPTRSVRPARVPVVSSIMGLRTSPGESMTRVGLRAYAVALGASRLIITAPAIEAVVRRLPIAGRRLVRRAVVGVRLPAPHGDLFDDGASTRQELGVSPTERIVMTIGRLDPVKSHDLFLRAAQHVASNRTDVRFFIVGEGPLRRSLEAELHRLGLASVVTLLGQRSDISRLLRATDVYVRPGVVEGFAGITVLEAQALGVPVVAFETEDVKLAVLDRETGLLVPPGDAAALGRALVELLDDAQLARSLGTAGRSHLERHFALPVVVNGLEALYANEVSKVGR